MSRTTSPYPDSETARLLDRTSGINSDLIYNSNSESVNAILARGFEEEDENKESSSCFGSNIRSIMFGGLDGISTVFVSVAAVFGGDLAIKTVIVIGIAKLLAGAISMGTGDYFSTKATIDMIREEKKREMWEFENYPEGEREEMTEIYTSKGLDPRTSRDIVDILSRDKEKFVDVMMVEELGYSTEDQNENPVKNGFVTFISFLIFGIVPLLGYLVSIAIAIACALTGVTLLIVGAVKSLFVSQSWWSAALFTFVVGVLSSGSGYGVAVLLKYVFHTDNLD